jgi:ribosome-binding protein aMBF1 (putative translation factor)
MKREIREVFGTLSLEKMAELKRTREIVEREDKPWIMAQLKEMEAARKAAQVELQRTCELLKAERENQGLSLADMQSKTGISRAALCRLENLVEANPTISTLKRIADALGKKLIVGLSDS